MRWGIAFGYQVMGGKYLESIWASQAENSNAIHCETDPIVDNAMRSRLSQAINHLQLSIVIQPKLSYAYRLLGQSYCLLGKFDDARNYYLEFIRLHPTNLLAQMEIGFLYEKLGNQNLAIKHWFQSGLSSEMMLEIADAERKAGNYAEALLWCERAKWLKPNWGRPWYLIGRVDESKGDFLSAVSAYQQAIALTPGDLDPYYSLGNLWQNNWNDHNQAIQIYELAANQDLFPVKAYINIAKAYEQLGNEQKALFYYLSASRLGKQIQGHTEEDIWKRVWPSYSLGDYYLRSGALDDAAKAFNDALSLDNQNEYAGWSLWGLGRIEVLNGQPAEALKKYFLALEYAENNYLRSQVNIKIGEIYLDQKNTERGIDYLSVALIDYPDNPGLHRLLADTLRMAGQLNQAIQTYESYLVKWPNDKEVIQALQETNELNHRQP
jgi:tetratricopeptide (TPR) repeat protein